MFLKCAVFITLLIGGADVYGLQQANSKTSQAPVVITLAPQPRQPWYERPEWIGVLITGLYVAISAMTLVAIKRQADSMSTQTERMSRQADLMNQQTMIALDSVDVARRAADAAKESADAANRSAEVAAAQTKAMTDRERARLYADTPPTPVHANLRLSQNIGGFRLTIRNVAPTAAINVKGSYCAIATEMQTPPHQAREMPMEIHEVVEGEGTVESTVFIFAAFADPDPKLAPLAFWCHVWGVLEYNDVLTDELHNTRFRFRIEMRQRPNAGVSSEGQWQKCGMHEDNQAA